MFARFRDTGRRLQVSLVETVRDGGRVRHVHIAGFGSVGIPQTAADRIEFWTKLGARLLGLSNRIDGKARDAIIAAIAARIPLPERDDRQAVNLERAEANARFWETISADRDADVETDKARMEALAQSVARREADAAHAAEIARRAKERLAEVERGEMVTGVLPKPPTRKELIALVGGPARVRECQRVAEIHDLGGWDEMMSEIMKRHRQADAAAVRAVLRRLIVYERMIDEIVEDTVRDCPL